MNAKTAKLIRKFATAGVKNDQNIPLDMMGSKDHAIKPTARNLRKKYKTIDRGYPRFVFKQSMRTILAGIQNEG